MGSVGPVDPDALDDLVEESSEEENIKREAYIEDPEEEDDDEEEETEEGEEEKDPEDVPDDGDGDEDEEQNEEEVKSSKKQPRVQKRIQSLIKRRKEIAAERDQYQKEAEQMRLQQQQYQNWAQQVQQQQQQLQEQYTAAHRELELLKQGQEVAEEANLDPVEKLRRQVKREAIHEAQAKLLPEIEQLKKIHEDFKLEQQKQISAQATQQRVEGYMREAEKISRELMSDLDMEKSKGLEQHISGLILNHAANSPDCIGLSPNKAMKLAGKEIEKIMMQFAVGKMKAKTSKNGERVKKSQKVPRAAPSARVSAKGKAMPSYESLRSQGFEDHLDWLDSQGGM